MRWHRETPAYDPETGAITRSGVRVEFPTCGGRYLQISFGGKPVYAHRYAWFAVHGEWPKEDIDHIDGNGHNNRIANLRACTAAQNLWNQRRRARSQSGERNVFIRAGWPVWCVAMRVNGQRFHWTAAHKASAIVASRLIRRVLHGEFARN